MTLILSYSPAGTYSAPPTLADAVDRLRHDLFDLTDTASATGAPRWSDDDLSRALDRALDEYSFIAPLLQAVMTAALPGVRAYALPAGAWWIERVEYPSGLWPVRMVTFDDPIITPSLGTPGVVSATASAGSLTGSYQWAVTYLKSGGETLPSPLSSPLTLSAQGAQLTIPVGPSGTVGRQVYRQKGGSALLAVGQLLDNTSTNYLDTLPDAQAGAPAPTSDSTANLTQFYLALPTDQLPSSTAESLTVTYACKHQLTSAGTSIPERDHDTVLLGGAAYALLAYQTPTNDYFEYQDGEMRDRVDERGVPASWLAAGQRALTQFQQRLETVKRERNAGAAAVARWGDRPLRWQRT